jgi:DNA-binding response OmpR family regulator
LKVLLVDDEDLVVEYLKSALRLNKYDVDVAYNGFDGYNKAIKNTYDVIILDVIMPKKSGLDVCRELRAGRVSTPILILSSSDTESDRVKGLDIGADDYMTKPFSSGELLARLRALRRRPKEILPDIVKVGDISIDISKRMVVTRGKTIQLTPNEYALMEYLMRRPKTVVSKEELLARIWGVSLGNTSNRIEVCVRQLRSKLETMKSSTTIKTVWGVGYLVD